MNSKFSDVSERDIDLLMLEEFAVSHEFAELFLKQICLTGFSVVSLEQSKVDVEFGESDVTVIVESNGRRHGLLIEDKINAIAMPNQSGRYQNRGQKGILAGDYSDYSVFIVAPEKYLSENKEAKKYPYSVTYEQIMRYFEQYSDARSNFKKQQIEQAINKQKNGYQVIVSEPVTNCWNKYIEYKNRYYPQLLLVSSTGDRGSQASWARYHTVNKQIVILHKMDSGTLDVTFFGGGDYLVELEKLLQKQNVGTMIEGLTIVRTGGSAALRMTVPKVNLFESFDSQVPEIKECFDGLVRLHNLVKDFNKDDINQFFSILKKRGKTNE